MSNKFKIKSRARTYTFSAPILMFEKKCFDWHFSGKDRTVVDDGYEATDHGDHITVKHKSHIVKRAWIDRPYCYKKNFLFGLTEFLSNIVSHIRVWAINLCVIAIIAAIALAAMGNTSVALVIAGVYAGLIAASYLFALLGLMWKKVFKLTEKTDAFLEQNGYEKWSTYDEN